MNKTELLQALEEKKNPLMRYNMQFFADDKGAGGDGSDNAGDNGDDDQDDDQDDKGSGSKSKKSDKTFTQAELDEAIKLRLKRERDKAKKAEQLEKDKQDNKNSDDKSKATDDKVSSLEAKLLCFEHDVSKDSVSDVVALAKAYVDEDTDFEEAIEKVIKKYPQFVKGSDSKKKKSGSDEEEEEEEDETDNKNGSWGQRQKGTGKKVDAVEAAFLKRNPGMKLD